MALVYNVGGHNEKTNIYIVKAILKELKKPESLIHHVTDRPGHDLRCAIDPSKVERLGWKPKYTFETAIKETIEWSIGHPDWIEAVGKQDANKFFDEHHKGRWWFVWSGFFFKKHSISSVFNDKIVKWKN